MAWFSKKAKNRRWLETMERRLSSVAVILETEDGSALAVKATYKPYWTFPGGVIDAGETPIEAAVREVKEELGLTIQKQDLAFVAIIDRTSDNAHTYQFLFKLTTSLTETMMRNIHLQSSEIAEYAIISKSQASTGDRPYGKVINHWMNDAAGYFEQSFDQLG